MQPRGRAFGRTAGGAADASRRCRLDQAFEAASAGADAERVERVDKAWTVVFEAAF